MSRQQMLVAHTSGYLDDDGELIEINAGRTRVAPECLDRPEYDRFFDPALSVRGTDATRTVTRTMTPDGRMIADPRFSSRS